MSLEELPAQLRFFSFFFFLYKFRMTRFAAWSHELEKSIQTIFYRVASTETKDLTMAVTSR